MTKFKEIMSITTYLIYDTGDPVPGLCEIQLANLRNCGNLPLGHLKETFHKIGSRVKDSFPEICFPKIKMSFPSYSLDLENNCTFKTGWSDDSRFPHA